MYASCGALGSRSLPPGPARQVRPARWLPLTVEVAARRLGSGRRTAAPAPDLHDAPTRADTKSWQTSGSPKSRSNWSGWSTNTAHSRQSSDWPSGSFGMTVDGYLPCPADGMLDEMSG